MLRQKGISVLIHSILVEKYSSHDAQCRYCDREGPVLMTKVRGMETAAQVHSIVVKRFSLVKHSIVCDGKGPVLMHASGSGKVFE